MNRIAVLIPCYNEASTIANVVSDFKLQLPQAEIYVYDNNSSDQTAQEAERAGAIVMTEHRQGKGYVIRSMFRRIDADIYVLVDGDNTYPASEVHKLIKPLIDGTADITVGDRLSSSYFTENKRPFHNSGNRLVRFLVNSLFSANLNDIMSGYRAFTRDFVKNFPTQSRGFEIETEMTVFAIEKDFRIQETPIQYRDRPQNSISKLNTFSDGKKVLSTLILLFRDYKPLKFFSIISIFTLIIGFVFLIPVLIEYWETGLVPRFPTLIVSCFIILFAMMLFFVGLLLDVSKQHKDEIFRLLMLQKNRP